jgi:hypothetical protein
MLVAVSCAAAFMRGDVFTNDVASYSNEIIIVEKGTKFRAPKSMRTVMLRHELDELLNDRVWCCNRPMGSLHAYAATLHCSRNESTTNPFD